MSNLVSQSIDCHGANIDDEVQFYKSVFPDAVPIVYTRNFDNPLKDRARELYGNSMFLIYEPLGKDSLDERPDKAPFYLLLTKNAYVFDKYVDYFFVNATSRVAFNIRKNRKVRCFGKVELLMLSKKDKPKHLARCRDAVSLAFRNGSPFLLSKNSVMTYLYHNGRLVETPTFFRWDSSTEDNFLTQDE